MKKITMFVFAAAVAGSYSMVSSAAFDCRMNCFIKYDECTLPAYKCEQIYKTCLRSCGA